MHQKQRPATKVFQTVNEKWEVKEVLSPQPGSNQVFLLDQIHFPIN